MLLTRCPGCRTTFRITADALEAAEGQVRCGRCSAVFDARDELSEAPTVETPMISPATIADDDGDSDDRPAPPDHSSGDGDDPLARTDEYFVPEGAFDSQSPDASDEAAVKAADLHEPPVATRVDVAEVTGYADEAALSSLIAEIRRQQDAADNAIGPEQVDAEGGSQTDGSDSGEGPAPWTPKRGTGSQPSRWWAVAAVLAVIGLAVQLLHYYRSELATRPLIGTWLSDGYSVLGIEIVPDWDLGQYQIMDWVANVESDDQVQSSLNITAHIQNRGPNPQPFPYVLLELKDRWDAPVGSRIFEPHEYMDTTDAATVMEPGQTTRAQLRVMDPGEDAYGFQLDVCIPASPDRLRCATDEVFR